MRIKITELVLLLLVSLCLWRALVNPSDYIYHCASSSMFVATFKSFLACISACLAALPSNPMDTNVAIEDSGGSGIEICPTEE